MNILSSTALLAILFLGVATAQDAHIILATTKTAGEIAAASRTALIQEVTAAVPTGNVQLTVGAYLRITVTGVPSPQAAEDAVRLRLLQNPGLLRALGVDCDQLVVSGTDLGSVTLPVYDQTISGNDLGVLRTMNNLTRLLSIQLDRSSLTMAAATARFLEALQLEVTEFEFVQDDCTVCATLTPTPTATPTRRPHPNQAPPVPAGTSVVPIPQPRTPVPQTDGTTTEPLAPFVPPSQPPTTGDEDNGSIGGGAIAGIVIGAILLALLIAGLLWWFCFPAAVVAAPIAMAKALPVFASFIPMAAPVAVPMAPPMMMTEVVDEVFNVYPQYTYEDEVIEEVEEGWTTQAFTSYPQYDVQVVDEIVGFAPMAGAYGGNMAPLNTPVTFSHGAAPWASYDAPMAMMR